MIEQIEKALNKANKFANIKIPVLASIFFIFFIVIYHLLSFFILNKDTQKNEFILFTFLTILLILAYIFIIGFLTQRHNIKKNKTDTELNFLNLISENTNEIIILLDNIGKIINFNSAFCRALNVNRDELLNKPFRQIFNLEDKKENTTFKLLLLDKLKEVLMGRKAEIISPILIKGSENYKSIYLKLTPKYIHDELENIFAIGRLLESDYITNAWLKNEKSNFVINYEISLLHIFCHRLTRNLEGKFTNREILFIQIALQEVLINAIEHGNLGIDFKEKTELKKLNENYLETLVNKSREKNKNNRNVYVDYTLEKDRVIYHIKDDGNGFDWKKIMSRDNETLTNDLLTSLHGVGLQVVKNTFDKILYNDKGNEVTLIKKFTPKDNVDESKL